MYLKNSFLALLLIAGCAQEPQPTGYFRQIHDEVENGVRTVRIDVDESSPNGQLAHGVNLTCFKPDGTKIPDWGLYSYNYGGYEDFTLLERARERLFGTPPKIRPLNQVVIHFKVPEPPPYEWPLSAHERWEYGRWLFAQGEYNNAVCRWTIYWIEEDDTYTDENGWDTSKWYEIEYIEF